MSRLRLLYHVIYFAVGVVGLAAVFGISGPGMHRAEVVGASFDVFYVATAAFGLVVVITGAEILASARSLVVSEKQDKG